MYRRARESLSGESRLSINPSPYGPGALDTNGVTRESTMRLTRYAPVICGNDINDLPLPAIKPVVSLRVVRVIDRLNVGGPSRHVVLLTKEMADRGYRTVLAKGSVSEGEAEMGDLIAKSGICPEEISGLGRAVSPLTDLRAFVSLYRLIRKVRPHLVHTHKSKAGVLGRLAAALAGVPVTVHTFHGHVFRGYFSAWKSALVRTVERLFGHWTDATVAVTGQQRSELLAYRIASRSRLHTVPLGLYLEPFLSGNGSGEGLRRELGLDTGCKIVGLVGRLVPVKGVEVFLEAARRVAAELEDVRFLVVGDGELRADLEALAKRLELSDVVLFTGFRRDMPRIYDALDLLVLSSFNEGLPVALIEGIAAGCYVVASRAGGTTDLVDSEQTGRTVAPGDAEALSSTIVDALKGNKRVPDGVRKQVGRRYGANRLVTDLDRLYRELLHRKLGRRAGALSPDCA